MKMTAIPKKMKAVVAHSPDDFRLETIDVPDPGDAGILIKVEACGICAGDVKSYHGARRFWGDANNPSYCNPPFIPGHEFYGRIVAMGPRARSGYKIGDRVISEQIAPCGKCRFCRTGKHWMCEVHDVYGFKKELNGGMAEYCVFPEHAIVYKVPDSLPMEKAVLIEPYACSKHAVDRGSITNEDVVVLSGVGTLGLGMVGYLRMKNPAKIVVLDMKDERLELAKKFGADICLNPSKVDVVAEVKKMTEGYGCDVYIEATGHPSAVEQGLKMIRKLGRFVEFSVFSGPATVDWSIISDEKELDVLGAHLSPYCYEPVIAWLASGQLPTDGVVTHTMSLDQWKEGFEMAGKGDVSLKVVLIP